MALAVLVFTLHSLCFDTSRFKVTVSVMLKVELGRVAFYVANTVTTHLALYIYVVIQLA